jgi:hypothetical protein
MKLPNRVCVTCGRPSSSKCKFKRRFNVCHGCSGSLLLLYTVVKHIAMLNLPSFYLDAVMTSKKLLNKL